MSEIRESNTESGGVALDFPVSDMSNDLGDEACSVGKSLRKVITAHGNESGLVLRIDGGVEWDTVLRELRLFLGGKRRFFDGGEMTVEWIGSVPIPERCSEIESILTKEFNVYMPRAQRLASPKNVTGQVVRLVDERRSVDAALSRVIPLSTTLDSILGRGAVNMSEVEGVKMSHLDNRTAIDRDSFVDIGEILKDDEASAVNSRLVFSTLRSGQRIETPHNLVIVGDVNPGADLVAGGDIIVLGSLRGTAHASAYDEDNQDGIIMALHMYPVQLRIGTVLSRGCGRDNTKGYSPEVAYVEDRRIVVEAFAPKIFQRRGRRF